MRRFYPADDGVTYIDVWVAADGESIWATCVSNVMSEHVYVEAVGGTIDLNPTKKDLHFVRQDKQRYRVYTSNDSGRAYGVNELNDVGSERVIQFLRAYESGKTKHISLIGDGDE